MTDRRPGGHAARVGIAAQREAMERLSALYRAHADLVWRQARRLGFEPSEAQDVVHEVFLVVRNKLDELDPARSPRPYLVAVTRRVAANVRRSQLRAAERERKAPTPAASINPEQASAHREAASLVASFLDSLEPEQRTVFELADIEGLTGPEIAQLLGDKLNTVYSRLRLARTKFKAFAAAAAAGGAPPVPPSRAETPTTPAAPTGRTA